MLKAKISKSAKQDKGRSLWITDENYTQNDTLAAINAKFMWNDINKRENYIKDKENFYLTIEFGHNFYELFGYCNKKRGDFYISAEEWINKINIHFDVGSAFDCTIVNVKKL